MKKEVFFESEVCKVKGLLSNPLSDKDKLILVLVHGFNSHKQGKSLRNVYQSLENQQISTFRIDLFGHGESSGDFKNLTVTKAINSVESAVTYLKAHGYKKIGLIGSSFGGLASIFVVAKLKGISCLILRSPVSKDQGDIISQSFKLGSDWKRKGFAEWKDRRDKSKILDYNFYEDSQRYNANDIAKEIHSPTLIIHGGHDHVVPVEQSKELVNNINNCRLEIIENADHGFTEEEDEKLVNIILGFLKEEIIE